MSELAELERRINNALDKIGKGLERIAEPAADAGDSEELVALREALNDERTANAQLEERVKTLRRKDEARIKELEDEIDDLKAAASETAEQMQQLQKNNQDLTAASKDSVAAAEAVAEAELQRLKHQVQKLRKARDGDRAELDEILGSLKPLLEEETNA